MYILPDLLPRIMKVYNTSEHSYLNQATYSRLNKFDSVYKYLSKASYIEGVMLGAGERYIVISSSILDHDFFFDNLYI